MGDDQSVPVARRIGRAFSNQYNVIVFFGCFLYAAALGSHVPALVAAAGEVLWLFFGMTSAGNRIVEKQHAAASTGADVGGLTVDALAPQDMPAYAERLTALASVGQRVRAARLDMTGVSPAELAVTVGHVDETQRSFLRLASLHQRLAHFLARMPTGELELDLERRTQALSREKDLAVRMALRQSLGLVQRRLQHRELTANMLRAVELRMDVVEQSFAYIETHVLNLGSALELKAEVDALVARVSSVEALEAGAGDALASAGGGPPISYPVPVVFESD